MYSIFARTAPRPHHETLEQRMQAELDWLIPLCQDLSRQSALFNSLGMITQDTQSWIDQKVAEYETVDDGLPDDLIAEFDRLAETDRVAIQDAPVAFAGMTLHNIIKMRNDGFDGLIINANTAGLRIDAQLSRTLFDDPQATGVFALNLPRSAKDDLWFSNATVMEDLMITIMRHIPRVIWMAIYPTMYQGMQKNLFRDRQCFGWMGYTPQKLEEKGPLHRIAPLGDGTFLQLKPDMMTLHAPDIALCHEAEAFLLDQGVLPLL